MEQQNYWQDQVALVTGASRGIGAEIALRLARLGAKVAINYNSSLEKALAVQERCGGSERTRLYAADVGNEAQVQEMVAKIEADLGAVTILVNNAGQTRDNLLMTMTTEEWRTVMSTHLDGAFFCSRAVLRGMLGKRHGRIVNISSVSGLKGTAGQCNYSAAKSGLIGFTKALSREMGKKKITCNALALGVIDTEMTQVLTPEVLKAYKDMTSLKRFGSVEEVSDVVEFLSGPQSSYMTGQVLTLDGGML